MPAHSYYTRRGYQGFHPIYCHSACICSALYISSKHPVAAPALPSCSQHHTWARQLHRPGLCPETRDIMNSSKLSGTAVTFMTSSSMNVQYLTVQLLEITKSAQPTLLRQAWLLVTCTCTAASCSITCICLQLHTQLSPAW